jgi:hypothetical protein
MQKLQEINKLTEHLKYIIIIIESYTIENEPKKSLVKKKN